MDLLARRRGRETIGRENILELREVVGDALRSREKVTTETRGGGQSRRGVADLRGTRRGWVKTIWLATSRKRLWGRRKSALGMGRDTGASWKGQLNMLEPKPKGIILEPEQVREDPSTVTNLTPEPEAEGEEEKQDTEARESTMNLLEERRSWRYIREELEALAEGFQAEKLS